jgi:hypothetical protein
VKIIYISFKRGQNFVSPLQSLIKENTAVLWKSHDSLKQSAYLNLAEHGSYHPILKRKGVF